MLRTSDSAPALLLAVGLLTAPAAADTVVLPATADNTLFESATGDVSNGAGPNLFAGDNSQSVGRRAVLRFDVASALPAGATVTAVTLVLDMNQTSGGAAQVALHRLTADWGEGASSTNGGSGAPAAAGDATWLHTFFPGSFWTSAGGDFAAVASATQVVDQPAAYSWSGAGLVADVQGWLDAPATDFGWIVVGDEVTPQSAKRFTSREGANASSRPALTVEFTPAEPGTAFCFGDGTGAPCPCGNTGGLGEGCASSTGAGMTISGSGSASLVSDDLALAVAGAPPGNTGLFLCGASEVTPGVAWLDGKLCIDTTGATRAFRGLFQTDGTAADTGFVAQEGTGAFFAPGASYVFQYLSRDVVAPSACGSGAISSPAYRVTLAP